jgi:hypothetical protein
MNPHEAMTKRLSEARLFNIADAESIIISAHDDLACDDQPLYSAAQIIEAVATRVATSIRLRAEEMMPY